MDYHSAILVRPGFLTLMQEAKELPRDLDILKTWYFTRLKSHADRISLLGVYNSLVVDLGFAPESIQGWMMDMKLHRNIKHFFETNPTRVSEERMAWFTGHQSIFRCDQYGHDTPVFRFDALEKRKRWPSEWNGMSRAEIELAIDETKGSTDVAFETEVEKECWLMDMASRWENGEHHAPC